jgi:hypothetical protein
METFNPDSEYRWYLTGSTASRIADGMARQARFYEIVEDPLTEANVMSTLIAMIDQLLEDPARGSKSDPGQAQTLTDEQLAPARRYLDEFIERYMALPPADPAADPELTAMREAIIAAPAPVHRRHDFRLLRSEQRYSGKLQEMVMVCEQQCECGEQREVVKRKGLLGWRVIRIRPVPRGTYR